MAGKKIQERKMPTLAKLIIKTLFAVLLGFAVLTFALVDIYAISEDFVDYKDDTATQINNCNRDYYDKDYSDLLDTLIVFELHSEEFDKYWEICDAYDLYSRCVESSYMPDGAEMIKQCQQQLLEMTLSCRFDDNRNRIRQMYEDSLQFTYPNS